MSKDKQIEQIELKSGRLDLRRLSFHILESKTAKNAHIEINGKRLDKQMVSHKHQIDLILLNPIQLNANDILTVTITGN